MPECALCSGVGADIECLGVWGCEGRAHAACLVGENDGDWVCATCETERRDCSLPAEWKWDLLEVAEKLAALGPAAADTAGEAGRRAAALRRMARGLSEFDAYPLFKGGYPFFDHVLATLPSCHLDDARTILSSTVSFPVVEAYLRHAASLKTTRNPSPITPQTGVSDEPTDARLIAQYLDASDEHCVLSSISPAVVRQRKHLTRLDTLLASASFTVATLGSTVAAYQRYLSLRYPDHGLHTQAPHGLRALSHTVTNALAWILPVFHQKHHPAQRFRVQAPRWTLPASEVIKPAPTINVLSAQHAPPSLNAIPAGPAGSSKRGAKKAPAKKSSKRPSSSPSESGGEKDDTAHKSKRATKKAPAKKSSRQPSSSSSESSDATVEKEDTHAQTRGKKGSTKATPKKATGKQSSKQAKPSSGNRDSPCEAQDEGAEKESTKTATKTATAKKSSEQHGAKPGKGNPEGLSESTPAEPASAPARRPSRSSSDTEKEEELAEPSAPKAPPTKAHDAGAGGGSVQQELEWDGLVRVRAGAFIKRKSSDRRRASPQAANVDASGPRDDAPPGKRARTESNGARLSPGSRPPLDTTAEPSESQTGGAKGGGSGEKGAVRAGGGEKRKRADESQGDGGAAVLQRAHVVAERERERKRVAGGRRAEELEPGLFGDVRGSLAAFNASAERGKRPETPSTEGTDTDERESSGGETDPRPGPPPPQASATQFLTEVNDRLAVLRGAFPAPGPAKPPGAARRLPRPPVAPRGGDGQGALLSVSPPGVGTSQRGGGSGPMSKPVTLDAGPGSSPRPGAENSGASPQDANAGGSGSNPQASTDGSRVGSPSSSLGLDRNAAPLLRAQTGLRQEEVDARGLRPTRGNGQPAKDSRGDVQQPRGVGNTNLPGSQANSLSAKGGGGRGPPPQASAPLPGKVVHLKDPPPPAVGGRPAFQAPKTSSPTRAVDRAVGAPEMLAADALPLVVTEEAGSDVASVATVDFYPLVKEEVLSDDSADEPILRRPPSRASDGGCADVKEECDDDASQAAPAVPLSFPPPPSQGSFEGQLAAALAAGPHQAGVRAILSTMVLNPLTGIRILLPGPFDRNAT
ncbi:hypothetical protein DIPPA_06380 [Diplonema papillatum]|nr:hypothetical protein DIPPA_06380 [Diplonema papillatum]